MQLEDLEVFSGHLPLATLQVNTGPILCKYFVLNLSIRHICKPEAEVAALAVGSFEELRN